MRSLYLSRIVFSLLALLAAAGSATTALGQDTAGRVDFAFGGVSATTAAGSVARPLAKGGLVFAGDTINTDNTGRAQIRFTDGAYVSLQPQTQFRVDNYRYAGAADGKEKGFFSLLKGGLRTITGVIGHTNRDSYQVSTPVATIGIRGTEYLASLVNGLELSIGDGSIFVLNKAGKFVLEQGQSAFIANQNTKPVFTNNPPSLPPAPAQTGSKPPVDAPVYVAGSQVSPSGTAAIVSSGFGVLPFGPGYALSVSAGSSSTLVDGQCAGIICGTPIVTLSGSGVSWIESTAAGFLFPAGLNTIAQGSASFNGGSAGGVIGWGSFTNGTIITTDAVNGTLVRNFGANEGVHFVIGLPTSVMPTTGVANMNLIGATRPTFSDNAGGGLGTGTVTSGTLTANFGSNTVSTTLNMSFSSGNSFSVVTTPIPIGNGIPGSPGFVVGGTFTNTNRLATICGSAGSCGFVAGGFFTGPGATYAGYGYIAGTPTFIINGAAAFH